MHANIGGGGGGGVEGHFDFDRRREGEALGLKDVGVPREGEEGLRRREEVGAASEFLDDDVCGTG
jgi:hypothetical protein